MIRVCQTWLLTLAVHIAATMYTSKIQLPICGTRSVYQELARLGSPEQQALLHKQLDDLAAPISFCKYKLKLSSDDDADGLSVPDSPSSKVIQVSPFCSRLPN